VSGRLEGRRVLVTQATDYMGPAIVDLFREEGASVVADSLDLSAPGAPRDCVERAGDIDVLVANLAHAPLGEPATAIGDEAWSRLFAHLVTPLMQLVRAALPQMVARHSGKIVAITSAAPLRGMPGFAAYCAARGAQNAFVRAVGLEVAPYGVQVNAIAQNYVKNPTYFPPELAASERFRQHVERNVPARRLAEGSETAELALFLSSDKCGFLSGQVIPFAGGWATTTG
jgi:2-keto-3-deoxy-L-fuconate dehydrogenase